MGYNEYSLASHVEATAARAGQSREQLFGQSACHPSLNPYNVKLRESRDSEKHPDSVGIVFALDVSGSMGEIPHQLATGTLPTFMRSVLTALPDPQVLFMAFGNAYADRSPVQVGQFESEAFLIDSWLGKAHIEGGGGGLGESYELAMYFAARHTAMDCVEKRGRKGYFFMTGDEVPFTNVDSGLVARLFGSSIPAFIPVHEIAIELQRTFHTFFLIPDPERAKSNGCHWVWDTLFGARAVVLDRPADMAIVSALLIGIQEGMLRSANAVEEQLEQRLQCVGADRDRLVRTVRPFMEALAAGTILPPRLLFAGTDSGVKG